MTTTTKTYCCARCGRYQPAARLVYSRWTRNRYCIDIKTCEKRAHRRANREPVAA